MTAWKQIGARFFPFLLFCLGVFLPVATTPRLFAAEVAPPAANAPIELPPMIVAESSLAHPWFYVKAGNTEYLSRCSEKTTRQFVSTQLRIHQLLRVFVPARFLATQALPMVSVVMPLASKPANDDIVSRDMILLSRERPGGSAMAEREKELLKRFKFLPNQRLEDRDMTAIFSYLDEGKFDGTELIVAADFVHSLLERRTPMLPSWLIEGVTGLYEQMSFRLDPITLGSFEWISEDETSALGRDPQARRILLPPAEFFGVDAWANTSTWDAGRGKIWRSQATLFVRWALDPVNAPASDALWKLAERASQQPMTENLFRECFGFGYSDLRDRLSDYLPAAVGHPIHLTPVGLTALPRFEVTRATPAQIARMRGEWERLEIPFVRAQHPQFLERYVNQARTTLHNRVRERDPGETQLLAALGLCELDAGDRTEARLWLEQAVADHVVRPRAYYELARLRWEELTGGKSEAPVFTLEQLRPVLEPLRQSIAQDPSLPEAYLLTMDAWLHCRERTAPADLAVCVGAIKLFHQVPAVGIHVALLLIKNNQRPDALALLASEIEFVNNPEARARYEKLQAMLTARSPAR